MTQVTWDNSKWNKAQITQEEGSISLFFNNGFSKPKPGKAISVRIN